MLFKIIHNHKIAIEASTNKPLKLYMRDVKLNIYCCSVCLFMCVKRIIHSYPLSFIIISELPHMPPTLWTEFTKYDPGDILRGNCSTQPSKPSATITFQLNQIVVSEKSYFFIPHRLLIKSPLVIFVRRLNKNQMRTQQKKILCGHGR